jgi:CRP-like cAMP-binding protein
MPAADPKIVEKIPFFRHLSSGQIQQLLHAGQMHTKDAGEMLCHRGDKSTEIYLLLSGKLSVKDGDTELAKVLPVDIVGEMGVVTNQPRSAAIEVWKSATLLSISKIRFDAILKKDVDMAAKIYRNMLESLSRKLRDTNEQLTKSQSDDGGEHIMASVV